MKHRKKKKNYNYISQRNSVYNYPYISQKTFFCKFIFQKDNYLELSNRVVDAYCLS